MSLIDEMSQGRPYLLVALPIRGVRGFVPVNATRLLDEWTLMIDPLRAMRGALPLLNNEWRGGSTFVVPSYAALDLLHRAAADEAIVSAFRTARSLVVFHVGDEWMARSHTFQELAPPEDVDDRLREPALPVLIGLAIAAALTEIIGFHGDEARRKAGEIAQDRLRGQRQPEGE